MLESSEFQDFQASVRAKVDEWFEAHRSEVEAIGPDTKPNDLVVSLGDDLLAQFYGWPLLDPYDVYEQLLSYWDETMHDDVFLVMTSGGWAEAATPRHAIVDKDKKLNETPDLKIGTGKSASKYKMDLIPPAVVAKHYFADDLAALDELNAAAEAAVQEVEEYIEEHAVDEGLLAGAVDDEKVTKASAKTRLKAARKQGPDDDETDALERVIALFDAKSAAEKAAKEAQATLDLEVLRRYGLDDAEARSLVLDDKWRTTIASRIVEELSMLMFDLADRVAELGDRYMETLGALDDEVEQAAMNVHAFLAEMGVR